LSSCSDSSQSDSVNSDSSWPPPPRTRCPVRRLAMQLRGRQPPTTPPETGMRASISQPYNTHTRGAHACTHAHTFNGPFPGTTRVSRYQKGKTDLDFAEARDSEWQWHQLGHMQVCTSLQTNNHASTPPLSFYRPDALPAAQPTASKH